MNQTLKINKCTLDGYFDLIPSKSYTHRCLIVAAFSKCDEVTINNPNKSLDIDETINCLEQMGAKFIYNNNCIKVIPIKSITNTSLELEIKESATTFRLLLPLIIHLYKKVSIKIGSRLIDRGFNGYIDIFKDNNIEYKISDNILNFNSNKGLYQNEFIINSNTSSQYVSGLLLLSLVKEDAFIIKYPSNLVSNDYLKLTLLIFKLNNISIKQDNGLLEINKSTIFNSAYYEIMPDKTINTNFFVYNYFGSNIKYDKSNIKFDLNGSIDCIIDNLKQSNPIIDCSKDIDSCMLYMVLSSFYNGAKFINIENLKIKESNRLESICYVMDNFNIKYELNDTSINIFKSDITKPSIILDSFNDHRICLIEIFLLSLTSGVINDISCLNKSYDNYLTIFKNLKLDCE